MERPTLYHLSSNSHNLIKIDSVFSSSNLVKCLTKLKTSLARTLSLYFVQKRTILTNHRGRDNPSQHGVDWR